MWRGILCPQHFERLRIALGGGPERNFGGLGREFAFEIDNLAVDLGRRWRLASRLPDRFGRPRGAWNQGQTCRAEPSGSLRVSMRDRSLQNVAAGWHRPYNGVLSGLDRSGITEVQCMKS